MSEPANRLFFRPRVIGRMARSMTFVCVPRPKVSRLGGFDPSPAALAAAGSTPDGSGRDEWPYASAEKASSEGQRVARAATETYEKFEGVILSEERGRRPRQQRLETGPNM